MKVSSSDAALESLKAAAAGNGVPSPKAGAKARAKAKAKAAAGGCGETSAAPVAGSGSPSGGSGGSSGSGILSGGSIGSGAPAAGSGDAVAGNQAPASNTYVIMRYHKLCSVVIRRKGGNQVLQVVGFGDMPANESVALKLLAELQAGASEVDVKELLKELKAAR